MGRALKIITAILFIMSFYISPIYGNVTDYVVLTRRAYPSNISFQGGESEIEMYSEAVNINLNLRKASICGEYFLKNPSDKNVKITIAYPYFLRYSNISIYQDDEKIDYRIEPDPEKQGERWVLFDSNFDAHSTHKIKILYEDAV